MSVQKIVLWPSPTLKLVSLPVDAKLVNEDSESLENLKKLVVDMATTMGVHQGVGLSAVQIGSPVRVVTTLVDSVPLAFVNPVIVEKDSETEMMKEGCLSVPDFYERVRRSTSVTVKFRPLLSDSLGPEETRKTYGVLAQALQHELEHLDGKMFIDALPAGKRQLVRSNLMKRRIAGQLRDYR